jgi:hypothetical protein
MGTRRRGPTLAERSGTTAAKSSRGQCHCWVIDTNGDRNPGLLLDWRKADGRWQGLVAYLASEEQGPVLIQRWMDADRLHST